MEAYCIHGKTCSFKHLIRPFTHKQALGVRVQQLPLCHLFPSQMVSVSFLFQYVFIHKSTEPPPCQPRDIALQCKQGATCSKVIPNVQHVFIWDVVCRLQHNVTSCNSSQKFHDNHRESIIEWQHLIPVFQRGFHDQKHFRHHQKCMKLPGV